MPAPKLSHALAMLGVLIIAAIVAFAAFFVTSLRDSEVKAIRNQLQIPASAVAYLTQAVARVSDLALHEVQDAEAERGESDARAALRQLIIGHDHNSTSIKKIEVYDAAGKSVLSSIADPPPRISVATYDFFKRQMVARDNRMIVGALVADPLDGEATITVSRPLIDRSGAVHGVIAVYLDAAHLQQILDSLRLPQGSSVTVFNADGRILVKNPRLRLGDGDLAIDFSQRTPYQLFRDSGPDGVFDEFPTHVGRKRFIASSGNNSSGFVVTAGWDAEEALAHWRDETAAIAGFTFLGIALIAALFAYILIELRRKEILLADVSRSDEAFRALMTAFPDAVMIIDPSLKIDFANRPAEILYGFGAGEMRGVDLTRLMGSVHRSGDEQAIRRVLANSAPAEGVRTMERISKRKDGTDLPVEICARCYQSPRGPMLISISRDVSKRQANDRALRRSRENLARAQRVAGVGSFERDLVTGVAEWSDEFIRIWGLSERPFQPDFDLLVSLVHPEDRQKFIHVRDDVPTGTTETQPDFRIIRPDGQERILHNEYSADRDANGRPIRLIGTVQDVTERAKIDIELRRSRENLARAQRIAGIGSFERDLINGAVHCSDEFYRIWGIAPGTRVPTHDYLATFVVPADRQAFTASRDAILAGKPGIAEDFRIVCLDGKEKIVRLECAADFDGDGKPIRYFGIIQDVTERKKTETELHRSREDLARAQSIAGIGSFSRDLTTSKIEWSDEFLRIWGIAKGAEEVTADRLAQLVQPEDRAKFLAGRNAALDQVGAMPLDFRVTRPDGVERILHREYGVVLGKNGKPSRMFGTVQDITERKRIEIELLRSREKLARAQRVAGIGSFERDMMTGEIEFSDEFYRIHGIAAGSPQATVPFLRTLVHPDDQAKIEEFRRASSTGEPTQPIDYRIIRPDGVERVLHRECSVLLDDAGRPLVLFGTVQDVTERKKIEIELVRSRENLARAQHIAGIGSFAHDFISGKLEWSDELLRIWGIERLPPGDPREFLETLVHPEDRQAFHDMLVITSRAQPASASDFRILRASGEERILHPEFQVVFDENGAATQVFGTVQDVTERKKIENELRRSRENLARAQHVAGIGSFERDLISGKIEWSDEFLRIWGVESKPSHGTAELLLSLVHPEDRQRFMEGRDAALGRKENSALDFRIIKPDGSERILHREYGVMFDGAGKAVRMFGTVQDITERKKIELQMRRSRENLARAQRIAAMGSFDRDFVTDEAEWSDEMYHVLGIEKEAMRPGPETLLKLVHPDDREKFLSYRRAELEGQALQPLEYRVIRPDGAERIVRRETVMVFDDEKRPLSLYGTLQDVTELRLAERRERELERQLLHSQKLEALGTLAGGIAHDLNNTLVPIMALSKLMARRFESGSLVRANLETIHEASERARDLVKRVVAFARKDEAEKRDTDLAELVDEVLKLLRATIPSSIALQSDISHVPSIPADASQIHQVVTNLVSNAFQAIGGEIGTIAVTLDVVPGMAGAQEIRLSVSDTGVGMDQATQQRIFEPFFTTKEVGQGTGLGLSIVHGIVTGHGGRVEVKSAPGKGTRFDLYFPVPASDQSSGEAPAVTSSRPAA